MNTHIEFPRYIDDPPTLLIWRLDDLMPIVLSLVVGILTGQLLLFLLGGWALSHGYRKFRDRAPTAASLVAEGLDHLAAVLRRLNVALSAPATTGPREVL